MSLRFVQPDTMLGQFVSQSQTRYIVYSIIALILTVFAVVFSNLISFGSVSPELLLILCVWIALTEGQFNAILFAFVIGIVFDIVSTDVIGSNALAKTIATFIAGYFFNEKIIKKNIATLRFVGIVGVATFIHNIVYYTLYIQPTDITFVQFFLRYGIAGVAYTMVVSLLPMLYNSRNMER